MVSDPTPISVTFLLETWTKRITNGESFIFTEEGPNSTLKSTKLDGIKVLHYLHARL